MLEVLVLADAIRVFEDGALIACHARLEGRRERRLDPTHRRSPTAPRRDPSDPELVVLARAGDRVARRSLDFYEAVGRRVVALAGAR